MSRKGCAFIDVYNAVNHYYNRMNEVKTYKAKENNLNKIVSWIEDYPELLEYWQINLSAHFYSDRVIKIKDLDSRNAIRPFFAYIINLWDSNSLKVGKTNDTDRRFSELERKYGYFSVEHIFKFPNEYLAYRFESELHIYFDRKYPGTYRALDRFTGVKITEEDLTILIARAEEIEKEAENWLKKVGL